MDEVGVAVMPVLLGGGIPLLPTGSRARLRLTASKVYKKSGIVSLEYAVEEAGSGFTTKTQSDEKSKEI